MMSSEKNIFCNYFIITLLTIFSFALVAIVIVLSMAESQQSRDYTLTTGSAGGTFYPVGVALSSLVNVKLKPVHNLSFNSVTSTGSLENIALLNAGQADFAILSSFYGIQKEKSSEVINKNTSHYLSISMLWPSVEQFIIKTKFIKTGTVSDISELKGQNFSIGKLNSGKAVLKNLGIELAGINLSQGSYDSAVFDLQDNAIQGINAPGGIPTSAITRAFRSLGSEISILGFNDEQIEKVNKNLTLWTRYVIPANTYPGQTKAINSMAQPTFLAVSDKVSNEDVYLITKTLYENLDFLNGIHKATRAMSIEKAFVGLTVPLHPGAVKFYQEKGYVIPMHLSTVNEIQH